MGDVAQERPACKDPAIVPKHILRDELSREGAAGARITGGIQTRWTIPRALAPTFWICQPAQQQRGLVSEATLD